MEKIFCPKSTEKLYNKLQTYTKGSLLQIKRWQDLK